MAIGEGKAALLRPDSDQPLSRRLETVRSFGLFQLLLDFTPCQHAVGVTQLVQKDLEAWERALHHLYRFGGGRKMSSHRNCSDSHVTEAGLRIALFEHSLARE